MLGIACKLITCLFILKIKVKLQPFMVAACFDEIDGNVVYLSKWYVFHGYLHV